MKILRKEGVGMYIKCEYCKKEFEKKTVNQKFCSKECARAEKLRKARGRYKKRTRISECKFCGSEFLWSVKRHDYCCDYCRESAKLEREEKKKNRYRRDTSLQPCWTCKNYIDGCSWARELKPVSGWVAEKVIRQEEGEIGIGYSIEYCPEYEYDGT